MKHVIEFKLMTLPKMTNGQNIHWRLRHAESKKWKKAVIFEITHQVLQKGITDLPWEKAQLTLVRASAIEPDFDGLVSGFKNVVDGIVNAGLLGDDKQSTIGQPKYFWEYAKRGQGHIRVKIEEINGKTEEENEKGNSKEA